MRTKGDDMFGLLFRRAGDNRWYSCRLGAVRNMVHLARLQNGKAASQLAVNDIKDKPLQDGRWYATTVKVRGVQAECYLDGVKLFDFKVDKHAAGAVGLESTASNYRFKNIRVTAPDGTILVEGLPDFTRPNSKFESRNPKQTKKIQKQEPLHWTLDVER
jgi:hypothetical protein